MKLLTPAFTIESDIVLPSGESLSLGTGICGSQEGASEPGANSAAADGVHMGPFTCQAQNSPISTPGSLSDSNSSTLQTDTAETEQWSMELFWVLKIIFLCDDPLKMISSTVPFPQNSPHKLGMLNSKRE